MRRQDLIALVKIAGYHEDTKAGARLLVEHRLSITAYQVAFNTGRKMKELGAQCACWQCKETQ